MYTLRPMFVRWQSRKHIRPQFGRHGAADVRWTAVVAETRRVDGKPRQRHVAYLGSITERGMQIDLPRCNFWDRVAARLDALGNQITATDRNRIEAAIADKVPRPTPAQYKDAARAAAQLFGWEWLTEPQRAALQDEAEQYQGDGELVGRTTASA